jgi:hypothetical protein
MWSLKLYQCYEWFGKIKLFGNKNNTSNIINNTHYYYIHNYYNEYNCHFIHKCGKKADRIVRMRSNVPPKNRNVCEECYKRLINDDKIKKE